ncbi:MAG TPA: adenine deaminase C-terminal domain-containing protein [Candidatus Methylomirabilis sp.]|nr:adenine deaminase C-terminal domain-containing protein [Candidatus Methylomirabilis sp.]
MRDVFRPMPSSRTITADRVALTAVARGDGPADRYLRGGTLLNVYTGEIYPANVAIARERIAYVGLRDEMVRARTDVIDVTGRILVPGYIEPHAHPSNLVTPAALARYVLPLGTTTIFGDTLHFLELGGLRAFLAVADALAASPLKFYWMIRAHGQSRAAHDARRFPLRAIARALAHPCAAAIGEVTRWPEVHRGDRQLLGRLALARARGLRVEGHTAGAAAEKVAALAAGGLTSDHEPITVDEVLSRARQGIAVMLRESSLRPDLGALLDSLKRAPALASRLMLTSDGAMPAFVQENGFVDHTIRVAIDRGVPPVDAYRMATLNPATYFNRDEDLGGIAPGRYADVCVLADLTEPRPELVIARGAVAAAGGTLRVRVPEPDWRRVFTSSRARLLARWRCRPDEFWLPDHPRLPVVSLVSAVITRLEERPFADGDLIAALIDRDGRWIAPGILAGFGERIAGLATTTTTDFNILALGRDRHAIAHAVNRVLDLRGGVVLVDRDPDPAGPPVVLFEQELPLGGVMSDGTLEAAARAEREFRRLVTARGYPFHDPLFTLHFLAADFLPAVRLSPRGVWDVKRGRVLLPSRPRRAGGDHARPVGRPAGR